jgi:hypothetical protein
MQKNPEERIVYLNSIFEKDSNGNYTSEALLYQDILSYFFEHNSNFQHENGFRFNDIAGWLVMKKNREFLDYYSDYNSRITKQHRINARRRRIQGCIDNLEGMALLFNAGSVKARRNNESTPLYVYSEFGQILAWIIRRNTTDTLFNKNEMKRLSAVDKQELIKSRKMAEEKIYDIIQSIFSEDKFNSIKSSRLHYERLSKNIINYRFFRRAKENGIIDVMIDTMRDVLQSKTKLISISDLFDRIVYEFTIFTNKKFREKVWNTFIATLNSLDEISRKIILFNEKMSIEKRISEESEFLSREWEELWLKNINDCNKLVLIGICKNCKESHPVLVDYYKYKEKMFLLEHNTPILVGDCDKCKVSDKLLISTWDKRKIKNS